MSAASGTFSGFALLNLRMRRPWSAIFLTWNSFSLCSLLNCARRTDSVADILEELESLCDGLSLDKPSSVKSYIESNSASSATWASPLVFELSVLPLDSAESRGDVSGKYFTRMVGRSSWKVLSSRWKCNQVRCIEGLQTTHPLRCAARNCSRNCLCQVEALNFGQVGFGCGVVSQFNSVAT
ncbi:hypothetical protein IWZ01DRAFT_322962, partial [Phyllosticta capitalensis]